MNFLTKVISTTISEAQRIIKVIRMGDHDVQEVSESSPFGVDSNPIAGMIAVYGETIDDSEPVIIGYINEKQVAAPGETRIYSTGTDGTLKTYLWLRGDATLEIAGNSDNMVRYSKLAEAFDTLKQDFNNLISTFNGHTHPVSGSTAGITLTPGMSSSADITPAKINEIKTL